MLCIYCAMCQHAAARKLSVCNISNVMASVVRSVGKGQDVHTSFRLKLAGKTSAVP